MAVRLLFTVLMQQNNNNKNLENIELWNRSQGYLYFHMQLKCQKFNFVSLKIFWKFSKILKDNFPPKENNFGISNLGSTFFDSSGSQKVPDIRWVRKWPTCTEPAIFSSLQPPAISVQSTDICGSTSANFGLLMKTSLIFPKIPRFQIEKV